jgi:hypothetical protein
MVFSYSEQNTLDGYTASGQTATGCPVIGTPEESIGRVLPGQPILPCALEAGEFHPRMYRGDYRRIRMPLTGLERVEFEQACEQEDILTRDLREITRVVAPDVATHSAYGSRIRNLLIMACTEIEAQWRGILAANMYGGASVRLNTNDYVNLFQPLRLADYVLKCNRFGNYPALCPFDGWNLADPTKSLPWYDAYNATKHDRVGAFCEGNVEERDRRHRRLVYPATGPVWPRVSCGRHHLVLQPRPLPELVTTRVVP